MSKKNQQALSEVERAAEAIWAAEFLVVVAGPNFDDTLRNPLLLEYSDPALLSQPKKFMGFWGGFFNEFAQKIPSEIFFTLSRWRDRMFGATDIRKKTGQLTEIPRFAVYTSLISNMFQKSGIPAEEVYEVCGNIFYWQCAANPVCSNRITFIDPKKFKFHIDRATNEAPFLQNARIADDQKEPASVDVMFSDDEDTLFLSGVRETDHKITADEKQWRQKRRTQRSGLHRISITLQTAHARFPDGFIGYVTRSHGEPQEYTFPESALRPADDDSAEKSPASLLPPSPVFTPTDTTHVSAVEMGAPVHPPQRCSHLLAHVQALDLDAFPQPIGTFGLVNPSILPGTKNLRFFQSGNLTRENSVRYNVSICIQSFEDVLDKLSSTTKTVCSSVVDPDLRQTLLSVNPEASDRLMVALHEAVRNLSVMEDSRNREQGSKGKYYFSHVKPKETQQEPEHMKIQDHITIDFPANGFYLPQKSKISVVCESVIRSDYLKQFESNKDVSMIRNTSSCAGAKQNPYVYTDHVWQMVGHLEVTAAPSLVKVQKQGYGLNSQTPVTAADTIYEYQLESNLRYDLMRNAPIGSKPVQSYCVKIGVPKNDTRKILYVKLVVPCAERDDSAVSSPSFVSKCVEQSHLVAPNEEENPLLMALRHRKNTIECPAPNHILCNMCHGMGRPYVLMSKPASNGMPAVKDDIFCTSALKQREKLYKEWEKEMTNIVKKDKDKPLVILEIGCDRKMDVTRAYSEKAFKLLKNSHCHFVRITPFPIDQKKKSAGMPTPTNEITVELPSVQALSQIDQILSEKARKGGR